MLGRKLAVAVLLVALIAPSALLAQPATTGSAESPPLAEILFDPSEVIALGADRTARMTVPVQLGGAGPFDFVVDTGSERTVLSRQLAEHLDLPGGPRAMIHGVAGTSIVSTVRLPAIAVNRQQLAISEAPLLERKHLGADGLLGIDSLVSRQVLFDFVRNEMSIHPARAHVLRSSDGAIVVRARSRKGRLIFTRAKLDGQNVAVIVDTGSQYTVGNRRLFEQLGNRDLEMLPKDATLISVTGAQSAARIGRVKTLDLGAIELHDFGMAFADADIFATLELSDEPALLLGMNAIRSFDRVVVDFANRKVSFVLPPRSELDSRTFARVVPDGGSRLQN